MKTVGHRHEWLVHMHASGRELAEGARFSEAIGCFSRLSFIPKGVTRFKTHEAANHHWDCWLAKGMAALAATRVR